MTRKIFWEDPYLTELTTSVASVRGSDLTLVETIFFAFSGGQERDHGTVGGREVLDAGWSGSDLVYTLTADHGLAQGDSVEVVIDGHRRELLRRLHMATEIVLELLTQSDPALVKVGAHIGARKARIDFSCEEPLTPRLGAIESAANQMILADLAVDSGFSDIAAERRYWEIAGFARVPCSGTHPRSTLEIGAIRLRRTNPGRGKERVELTLAEPVTTG